MTNETFDEIHSDFKGINENICTKIIIDLKRRQKAQRTKTNYLSPISLRPFRPFLDCPATSMKLLLKQHLPSRRSHLGHITKQSPEHNTLPRYSILNIFFIEYCFSGYGSWPLGLAVLQTHKIRRPCINSHKTKAYFHHSLLMTSQEYWCTLSAFYGSRKLPACLESVRPFWTGLSRHFPCATS